jgi:preprotein translocase subunit Sec63
MAAGGLGYDEQGSLATYFVLTFLSLVLLPSTLWTVKSGIKGERMFQSHRISRATYALRNVTSS